METVKRYTSRHPDFEGLVGELDQYLAKLDGKEHTFYNQFNSIKGLKHTVVLYKSGIPLGCGALKYYEDKCFEIKRMFVHPTARGQGIAQEIIVHLERWAKELGAQRLILETGKRMPRAIGLYQKMGYTIIKNYEPYINIDNSLCFSKSLNS